MKTDPQLRRAQLFLELHHRPEPLILPNAWDVVSARLFGDAGFPAVATTSAGVAWSLGYPDGEHIPREEMLAAVARIARALDVPLTADLEAGYGPSPEDVAETVRGAIAAGAVGMNLEDSHPSDGAGAASPLFDEAAQVERVVAARATADLAGNPFVVNARTDVFLRRVGAPEERLRLAIDRANAYRAAGADVLFVPGVVDAPTIAELVREIDGPLNILATPGIPDVAELTRLGVARVSVGGGPYRSALSTVARGAAELRRTGSYAALLAGDLMHADLNALMSARGSTPR
jgi:2-methylisocitrate lyase-like PEP mutase family enzyme